MQVEIKNSLRKKYMILFCAIFFAEILIATVFQQMHFIRGNLGDFLVVGLVYFVAQFIQAASPFKVAIAVFLFACTIEVTQYFHLAELLGLKRGELLYIMLGNSFSCLDILMYLGGSLTAMLIDEKLLLNNNQAEKHA